MDGLKIFWKEPLTDIKDIHMKMSGIKVAFDIADVLKFDGAVLFIDEIDKITNTPKRGFKGGVKITLHPLDGMMLDAQFIAGRNTLAPSYNFFYIFIGAELPVGIPLGSTGASLYGMAGLFGYNMLPKKAESEEWYGEADGTSGWYKRAPQGISGVEKWADSRESLALGAGVTLGTADNGFTFSGKVLLVVLIPGPMILVEGKAQFLKERKNLDADPIFRMLAVLDPKSGTFLMNIEARYKNPEKDGLLININGGAEAFFNFNNPNAWHFYLGQDTPEAKRIRARVLSLFEANAFVMLDANGVLMGAWAGYDRNWKYGPLSVVLQAWIEGRLGLSYKPPQADGMLALNGNVQLKAFGQGLGLSVYAGLLAKAPTPWYVRGEFDVKLDLPWPLPDPKAHIVLEWQEELEPLIPLALAKIGIEHLKVTEKWDLVKYPDYDTDKDGFRDGANPEPQEAHKKSPIIPLDARPVLTFARAVEDGPFAGNNLAPPPAADIIGDYQYKYRLKKVVLTKSPKIGFGTWVTVAEKSADIPTAASSLFGHWQVVPGKESQNLKLMLWSNTPFEISRELASNHSWLYSTLAPWKGYPCNIDINPKLVCVDFEKLEVGSKYRPVLLHDDHLFFSEKEPMVIVECPVADAPTFLTHYVPAETVHGLTITGLGREEEKHEKYCIGIPEIPQSSQQVEIIKNTVVFRCAVLPSGNPSHLAVNDYFPSMKDSRNEIVIGWSQTDEGNAEYATINFPEDRFPEGPNKIIIDCGHYNLLTFRAYDHGGNLVDEKQHTAGQGILQKIVLSGENIRHIDIIGAEIAICELCYEMPVIASNILVVLPEKMTKVGVYLASGSKGKIAMLKESGEAIGEVTFNINSYAEPVILESKDLGEPINAFLISGAFIILKICGLTTEESLRVEQNESILQHIKTATEERWGTHEGAFLEPNCYYRLIVETETLRRRGNDSWSTTTFTEHAYFQTENPPGAYQPTIGSELEIKPESEHYPQKGPLKDLSPYISSTIPSQAASNEPLRPAYRSYDIGVKFNEPQGYIEQMYLMAGLPLTIRLFDNNSQPVLNMAGNPVVLQNNWGDNPDLIFTREEKQWKAVLNSSVCGIDFTEEPEQKSASLYVGSKDLVLKPQTLYKAKLCGGGFPVYEFNFITSRYCTFTHHIHSFADSIWNHHKLIGSPLNPLLDNSKLSSLRNILSPFTKSRDHTPAEYKTKKEQESGAFEQLAGPDVFDLGIRQLPERVEILLLNDSTQSYGLLLESPEPIDWERVDFWVKHATGAERIEESLSTIKIIRATTTSAGGGTNCNEEMVEIIMQDQIDISGLKIRYKKPSDTAFSDYYTFGSQSLFPACMVIQIHSGRKFEHHNPSLEIEHHYVTADTDSPAWHFDPAGELIQIVDPSGKVLHSRLIMPYSNDKMETILIRNKDKTRAFIFFLLGSEKFGRLANGRFCFNFKFKRKMDGTALPVLKRMGSENDEDTQIESSLPTFLA